ncbi:HNH endonuclease [Arthrobacter humicola]
MTMTPAGIAPLFEPDHCANCFEPLPADYRHRPWLFCNVLCRETANTIRYWRKTARDGRFDADPEVRYAIGIRLAHMLRGGYDSDVRRIPTDVRVLVIERDKACVRCGGPGEEIDHIDEDGGDPGNLQLLCKTCHHAKTAEYLAPASQDQSDLIFVLLIARVVPTAPAQLCDDEIEWVAAERTLRGERIVRLRSAAVRDQAAASEAAAARKAAALALDFDDDDDEDRDEDYYAGYGQNTHYAAG